MNRYRIEVETHGDCLHMHTGKLPPEIAAAVAAALASNHGLQIEPLHKGRSSGEGPDPRFPELQRLVESVRPKWLKWSMWLLDHILAMFRSGRTPPAGLLARVFSQHEIGAIAEITGATQNRQVAVDLIRTGDLPTAYQSRAPVSEAFAHGLALDSRTPPRIPTEQAIPRTPRTPLSDSEVAAAEYARSRAGIYLQKPVTTLHQSVQHALIDSGLAIDDRAMPSPVREAVAASIETREKLQQAKRRIEASIDDAGMLGDVERIARTELQQAHSHGAYTALRARAGEADPLVYKIASPGACEDCLRIWGHPGNPVHYKLSAIEAHEAAGANFRRKRSEWGPTIGPTHPNCTCPPLLEWHPDVHDAVQDIAAELARTFGSR